MRQSSIEAFQSVKPKKSQHYKIIKLAMKSLKKPSISKVIAQKCQLSYHQVARRLAEMESMGMIKVVGRDHTVSNRPMLWDINGDTEKAFDKKHDKLKN